MVSPIWETLFRTMVTIEIFTQFSKSMTNAQNISRGNFFFNRISGIFRKMRFPPPLFLCPAGRDLCVTRKACYIMESENQE